MEDDNAEAYFHQHNAPALSRQRGDNPGSLLATYAMDMGGDDPFADGEVDLNMPITTDNRASGAIVPVHNPHELLEAGDTAENGALALERDINELNQRERRRIVKGNKRALCERRADKLIYTMYSSDEEELENFDAEDELSDDEPIDPRKQRQQRRKIAKRLPDKKCSLCKLVTYAKQKGQDVLAPEIVAADKMMKEGDDKASISEKARSMAEKMNTIIRKLREQKNGQFMHEITKIEVMMHYGIKPFSGKGCVIDEIITMTNSIKELEAHKACISRMVYTKDSITHEQGMDHGNYRMYLATIAIQNRAIKDVLAVKLLKAKLQEIESRHESTAVLVSTSRTRQALIGNSTFYPDETASGMRQSLITRTNVFSTMNE